jgi:hypothetical protein
MATISAQDYGLFREALYQGEGKTLLKAQPALPNEFALRAIAATIAGAFLVDNSTKGGTTGTLYGAGDFNADRSVSNGDTLNVQVDLSITSS